MQRKEILSGVEHDKLAAKVALPLLVVLIYGAYKFLNDGLSPTILLWTYVPVFGSILSTIGLFAYLRVVRINPPAGSLRRMGALFGFMPYIFSLYVVGFLGIYSIYTGLVGSFSILAILGGTFWVLIGYRLASQLYLLTEIVRQRTEFAQR